MISQEIIEDIKYRNNIEDVISSYVTLNRSGNNLKGLCPFHSERTPSFTVYTGQDSHFFCYGCGAGGDVVNFIMRAENLDYVSALEYLANRAGVTIPSDDKTNDHGVSRSRVIKANLEAAKFYRNILFSDEGKVGAEYFTKRQLKSSVIKHFGLGYAPDSFFALRDHLKKNGFTDEELIASDLCHRSKKNPEVLYDAFRNRVMFPIIDLAGNIIAFGGRVLDDSKPKYLNTGDTVAFKKSKNLFALNYAKNNCSDGFILCEGYMDVIALHASGFENAVATLGTAITPDHARILKKYSEKVYISYDSDEAGQKAADRALKILSEVDIDAKVIKMTGAKDPDEYIKSYGSKSFGDLLKAGKNKIDFEIDRISAKYNLLDSTQKILAAKELCNTIANVYSGVEREIYISTVSKYLDISVENIKNDVNSIIKKNARKTKADKHNELIRETSGIGNRINPDFAKDVKSSNLEYCLIGIMLLHSEYIEIVVKKNLIDENYFASDFCKKLFSKMVSCFKSGGFDFCMLSEDFTIDEVSEAERMLEKRRQIKDNSENVLYDCVDRLKKEYEKRISAENNDPLEVIMRKRKENNIL